LANQKERSFNSPLRTEAAIGTGMAFDYKASDMTRTAACLDAKIGVHEDPTAAV